MSFEAKFGGYCRSCDDRIHIGDLATYAGDQLVHADCEESSRPEPKADICARCWMTKPCDCEETI